MNPTRQYPNNNATSSSLSSSSSSHIGIIQINNPPVNALSNTCRDLILNDLKKLCNDAEIKIIILTGIENYFSAGADVKELELLYNQVC